MARDRARRCRHGHGRTLCFECFRDGSERTRARQEAWAQRTLPFESAPERTRPLTETEIAHRRRMLAYLEQAARRRGA
jgi:hypothetical protein